LHRQTKEWLKVTLAPKKDAPAENKVVTPKYLDDVPF